MSAESKKVPPALGCLIVLAIVAALLALLIDSAGATPSNECWPGAADPSIAFCFKWERDTLDPDNPRVILQGLGPWGNAVIAGVPDESPYGFHWQVTAVDGSYPWPQLAQWTADYLNGTDNPDPLLWRPDLMNPYREWLYFTRLHARGQFYLDWYLESDNAGNVGIAAEGSFPDGVSIIRRVKIGGDCWQWTPDWTMTSDAAEYVIMADYIADVLNANENADYQAAQSLVPLQLNELIGWLEYVAAEWGGMPQCFDEPPFVEYTYLLYAPAVMR